MYLTAGLWGLDLGLVFTTWITFAGPWFLAAVSLAGRDPWFGAAVFSAHWLGRACWVWLAPFLLPGPSAAPQVLDEIDEARPLFSLLHSVGLAMGLVGAAWWAIG
jgi:hypothetical protein